MFCGGSYPSNEEGDNKVYCGGICPSNERRTISYIVEKGAGWKMGKTKPNV